MSEWQAIESAQKDGKPILVWGPNKNPRAQYGIVAWCGCHEEWRLCDDDEQDQWIGMTHWMPLPEPPSQTALGSGE